MFLLNAVNADELTQALVAYGLARRAGIRHVTYFSIFRVNPFRNVPHFAPKVAVESALRDFGVPFTGIRAAYWFQNDAELKPLLLGAGVYPMPIGTAGIAAVDVRDVAEAAAISLTEEGHVGTTYELVGPSLIDGPGTASFWSTVLGKKVRYAGHDSDAWEKQMRSTLPPWLAFDLRMMFEGMHDHGFASTPAQVERVKRLLGQAPRTYEAFARQTAAEWLPAEQGGEDLGQENRYEG